MEKRTTKAQKLILSEEIDKIIEKLPSHYTHLLLTRYPKRYTRQNKHIIYNVINKRRYDRQVIKDLKKICQL